MKCLFFSLGFGGVQFCFAYSSLSCTMGITGLASLLKLIGHMPAGSERIHQVSFAQYLYFSGINFILLSDQNIDVLPKLMVLLLVPLSWNICYHMQGILTSLLVTLVRRLQMQHCLHASLHTTAARKLHPSFPFFIIGIFFPMFFVLHIKGIFCLMILVCAV